MKNITLTKISDKLYQLSEDYAEKHPSFYASELRYTQKRAQIMLGQSIQGLGTQALREAECDRMMSETEEYLDYHTRKPEMDVISRQTWIFTELAKNIRASQWEGGEAYGK